MESIPMRGDSVGINTAISPSNYSDSYAFTNMAKMTGPWRFTFHEEAPLDSGGGLMLPPGKTAFILIYYQSWEGQVRKYPLGLYEIRFEGDGDFECNGVTAINAPGKFTVPVNEVDPSPYGLIVRCTRSNPNNTVKHVGIWTPGYEDSKDVFREEYLRGLRGNSIVRTMQDTCTIQSTVVKWSDRPKLSDDFWDKGIPWEAVIEMANRTGISPWICVPHLADDDYIRQLAKLFHKNLRIDLKLRVELSNEIWNWAYPVSWYQIGKESLNSKSSENNFYGHTDWIAWRSRQIFDIFEAEYGTKDRGRLLTVLASQSGWPEMGRFILNAAKRCNGGKRPCDIYSVAPYFYPSSDIVDDSMKLKDVSTTMDQLFADLTKVVGPGGDIERVAKANRAIADEFGVSLEAYEAGQHLLGADGVSNKFFNPAVNDPRMEEIYTLYLDTLFNSGYQNVVMYAEQGGFWGVKESATSRLADFPRWRAIEHYKIEANARIIPSLIPKLKPTKSNQNSIEPLKPISPLKPR